ncbi:MAG: hypothetical protein IPL08_12635 [Saprospiraceae bacterium]|nr:hypothetical protein [Saprospiraceae bacterium]
MKHLIFTIFLFYCLQNHALSQDVMVHKEMIEMKDSVKVSCTNCYSNLVSVGGKYYFNPLKIRLPPWQTMVSVWIRKLLNIN